jgi:hypothetical protein
MYLDQTKHILCIWTKLNTLSAVLCSRNLTIIWNVFTANCVITVQLHNNIMLHKCKYSILNSVWREIHFFTRLDSPSWSRPPVWGSSITRGHTHSLGRAPLYKWSDLRNGICLTTHNTHKRKTAGCEPATPASKRPQTHALERAATGIGREITCL